jgi:hypothetical protein
MAGNWLNFGACDGKIMLLRRWQSMVGQQDVIPVLKESVVGQSEGTVSYRRTRQWGRNEIEFRTSGTVNLWLTCQEHLVGPMAGYCGVRLGIAAEDLKARNAPRIMEAPVCLFSDTY